MHPRAACLLALLTAAGPAAGQTKSFFAAECWYTAAGPEWEWLDPIAAPAGPGKVLAHLRRPDGRTFTLRYWPQAQRPDVQSFQAFEDDLVRSGDWQKLDSRRRSFKGASCHEIDVRPTRSDQAARVRVLFANDNVYQLTVADAADRLGPAEETDPIFQGFEFRPPEERKDDEDEKVAKGGPAFRVLVPMWAVGVFVVLSGIGLVVWVYRVRKSAVG
ncbi:MAG: hypothetical protein J2P46_11540 [Zavarzinella sp.]|nr:hypothetical protein [Zavarzinella sp.]